MSDGITDRWYVAACGWAHPDGICNDPDHGRDPNRGAGRAVQDDGLPTVEALAQAMWDALSDNGILRIDADSPKELNDIAATIHRRLRATPALPEPEDAPRCVCIHEIFGQCKRTSSDGCHLCQECCDEFRHDHARNTGSSRS